jgi:uncharacterized protein
MTPQERQLVAELFERLATLEQEPRDPEAERLIREGLQKAPNAIYPLVQTVLLQDEALKVANAHIQELEGTAPPQQESRGFLDSMRDSLFGREEPRGSVPRVAPGAPQNPWSNAPMGAPPGYRTGYDQPGAPMQQEPSRGGSFLGTAAAVAAGAIGGSLLMGGLRNILGGQQQGPFAGAFDQLSGPRAGSPWDSGNATGDLARQAGLDDIGGRRTAFGDFDRSQENSNQETRSAGLFDSNPTDDGGSGGGEYEDDGSVEDDASFDSGDSDTA